MSDVHQDDLDTHHVGRGFAGHTIEDNCPCPQEPCGLVRFDRFHPDCDQHRLDKTIRQGHSEDDCVPDPDFKKDAR